MGRYFPTSWAEHLEGIHNAYDLQEVLEARIAAGVVLTPEEEHLLKAARKLTLRYEWNGRRKETKTRVVS